MKSGYRDAFQLHVEQHKQVRAASGIEFGWRVVDRLFLAKSDSEADELRRHARDYEEFDRFSARWMDPAEIARWDPRIGSAFAGGLMTSGNVRVDAERYRLALLAAAARLGAVIVTACLQSLQERGGLIEAIEWGEGKVPVSALCMATGAWAAEAVPGWSPGNVPAVFPILGDLLLVRSTGAPPLADISYGLTAIYQHHHDYFWLGGTTRLDGPLGESSDAIERELFEGARSLMPGWNAPRLVARSSAARPSTSDCLPVVGQAPNYKNGWIINGLGSKGMLLSIWAAEGILRMMNAGGELPEFAAVSPSRSMG